MPASVWWVRRDLRLRDNPALAHAIAHGPDVVPVFILDERLLASRSAGARRNAFLLGGLAQLDRDLRARGSRLIVRRGLPEVELARLCAEVQATTIVAQQDCSPFAQRRDQAVMRALSLVLVDGVAALPIGSVRKADGNPYTVFTPYSHRRQALWQERIPAPLAAPQRIDTPAGLASCPLPDLLPDSSLNDFVPGEPEAWRRLRAFTNVGGAIHAYAEQRNRPDLNGTSRLSPYLRFGMLSAQEAVLAALAARDAAANEGQLDGATTWLNELIWRDFFIDVLHAFPRVAHAAFRPQYDAIAWHNDPDQFDAWTAGRTGYPFVDAAMRQLAATGWMHNRARMVVASFLVKDLLIDWRWGARWFMQQLIDGDPAANNGGWQWSAGTGTDAAPYFRIFNPVTQGAKLDPCGDYIRRWIPELRRVPDAAIHTPWKMSPAQGAQAGCVLGRDYPSPIVDHAWARRRTLDAYQAARL